MTGRPCKLALSIEDILGALVENESGCLVWPHGTGSGYGMVGWDGVVTKVHRLAWRFINGPIPEGHDIHHKCENRRCANVDHLEAMTRSEHVKRHQEKYAQEAQKVAKKPRPRVQGKLKGRRLYPWEYAELSRKALPIQRADPNARERWMRLAAAGQAPNEAKRKKDGEHRRVVFHISLTGNYGTRLVQAAEATDGNCSRIVREGLDLWFQQEGLPPA